MLRSNKRTISITALIALLIVGLIVCDSPSLARDDPSNAPDDAALILLADDADLNAAIEAIEAAGGRVKHVFPPSTLIGLVPPRVESLVDIRAIYRQDIDSSDLKASPPPMRRAAWVWNALYTPRTRSADKVSGLNEATDDLNMLQSELVGDAFTPPAPLASLSDDSDPTPNYAETSEYFIGRVAVGIILPQSDGSVDPSSERWTLEERALVLEKIAAALDWWAELEPRAQLTFVYDDDTVEPVETRYEPISRPYSDQSLWIAEVMEKKGYTSNSYFDQVRHYNHELRQSHDADWAFTIFVVDSSHDDDNRFADGYFAYAYLGGPFTVMTTGNNGYGIQNLDAVAAHEVGHIFFALDQYYAAQQSCTLRSGYLGVENQNSQYGDCELDKPSIMRGHISPYRDAVIDDYARGQLGWRDSDGDGIFDPVDTPLAITGFDVITDTSRPGVLTVSGQIEEEPYSSPRRRDIIINRITEVEYRVAGGEWIDASPVDEAFDAYVEEFTFTTAPLPGGDWEIDLRVQDSAGNRITETLTTVSVVGATDVEIRRLFLPFIVTE